MDDVPAGEFARRYLEDLLSFFGLNLRVDAKLEDNTIELGIPSSALNGFLIGQRGQNLRAIQHLMNMAVRRAGHDDVLVIVDVAGYRRQRAERLERQAAQLAKEVISSGEAKSLPPMGAADRRVIHQAIGAIEGAASASDGEGRDRHVVIKPSN